MADYENKVHNIYGHAYYQATEKLGLFGSINFNKAEGGLEQVEMPELDGRTYNSTLGHDDLDENNYDFTSMHTYSDFNYTMLKFKAGFKYRFTPDLAFTADGLYADLTDDEGYVYGNESGSYFVIRTGFKINF